jgi:hypothetical protein
MTITLPLTEDADQLRRAIDAQMQLSPADAAAIRRPHDAQAVVQELLRRCADVELEWTGGER